MLVRVTRAGINFADTHARENTYIARYELPLVPGAEVAGVREDGGRSASSRSSAPAATRSTPPRREAHDVPDPRRHLDGAALALLDPGPHRLAPVPHRARSWRAGESVVVHAAAGGVGSLAVQLGKRVRRRARDRDAPPPRRSAPSRWSSAPTRRSTRPRGPRGRAEEANGGRARRHRARDGRRARLRGRRCAALAPFGRLVVYGIASREPNQVSSGALMRRSQAVIGFWLAHCLGRPADGRGAARRTCSSASRAGELRVVEGEVYGLSEVRRAHEDLQARRTTGKLVLDPAR